MSKSSVTTSISSVTGDNHGGGTAVANLLLAAGHTRFAYISGKPHTSTSQKREKSFCDAIARRGLPVEVVCGNYSLQDARNVTRDLLSSSHAPEALFYANDHMALAGMEVARHEFGLTPGEDISIAGFDDIPAASWPSFNLTTYSQPVEQMKAKIVELLLQAIEEPDMEPQNIVVKGDLIHRSSTRRKQVWIGS